MKKIASILALVFAMSMGMAYAQERPVFERPTLDSFCSCWNITPVKPGDIEREAPPHWLDMIYWCDKPILDWWETIPALNQAVLTNIIMREIASMKEMPDYETWTVEEFFIAGPVQFRNRLREYLSALGK